MATGKAAARPARRKRQKKPLRLGERLAYGRQETADLLGISLAKLDELIRKDEHGTAKLKSVLRDGRRLIRPEWIEAYLDGDDQALPPIQP
jgi:hypothetical protein